MFKIKPRLLRVQKKSDIPEATRVGELLSKHGYKMTAFSFNGVGFFRKSAQDDGGEVPHDAWYFLTKKEFRLFLEILTKLSDTQDKLDRYVAHMNKVN